MSELSVQRFGYFMEITLDTEFRWRGGKECLTYCEGIFILDINLHM